jgi:hypothetical protein
MDEKIVAAKFSRLAPNPPPTIKPTIGTSIPPVIEKESKVEQSMEQMSKPEAKETETVMDFDTVGEDYLTNPTWYEIVNYLNIGPEEYNTAKNEVVDIVKYVAQEIQSDKLEEILTKLKQMRSNMYDKGDWGERLHKVLYRYVKLAGKRDSLDKAVKAYEKGGKLND